MWDSEIVTVKQRVAKLEKSAESEYLKDYPGKLYSKSLVACQPGESPEEAAKRLGLEPEALSIVVVGVKAE